jgi:hypothetical protein
MSSAARKLTTSAARTAITRIACVVGPKVGNQRQVAAYTATTDVAANMLPSLN